MYSPRRLTCPVFGDAHRGVGFGLSRLVGDWSRACRVGGAERPAAAVPHAPVEKLRRPHEVTLPAEPSGIRRLDACFAQAPIVTIGGAVNMDVKGKHQSSVDAREPQNPTKREE
eukprot:1194611-Prorocentrum_minimum.AAC.8